MKCCVGARQRRGLHGTSVTSLWHTDASAMRAGQSQCNPATPFEKQQPPTDHWQPFSRRTLQGFDHGRRQPAKVGYEARAQPRQVQEGRQHGRRRGGQGRAHWRCAEASRVRRVQSACGRVAARRGDAARSLLSPRQTTFLPTQAKSQLDTHRESRHPDKTFEQCFPDYGAVAAEAAPAAAAKKK